MPRTSFISTACRAGFLRRLTGLCAIFMLVLQTAFPSAAQVAAGGDWIEICGEFGVVEIQIGSEDSSEPQDCPKCSTCPLCAAENGAGPVSVLRSGISRAADCAVLLPAETTVQPNPAQYWHEGRGPPLVAETESERALRASVAATLTKGEAPWS
ncbi:hypothetical protein [Leisingera sp. NJS204]|uniref:hypothetical protein n=1 Tax=Leisingera sp. NJS204 TaxID=2508307 RepID=UPI001010E96F|nr:hypothetical protein [Leisingera sp. NJS204]QAX30692.1 hypothetical protein ETW24_15660 [Leisingera sp. NJS204]